MQRLIDADALIHKLKTAIELGQKVDESVSELEAVLDDVESMPTIEAEPHWIPCSERLPEEKGEYLVTYHPCYWDDVKDEIRVGIDTFRGRTTWAKKKHQRVIAWMPMPEPYEVKE